MGKKRRSRQKPKLTEDESIVESAEPTDDEPYFNLPLDRSRYAGLAIISLTIAVWFFPLLLGKAPVGGEIISVYLPKMTFYADALAAGRIPLWNEFEDFGTPVLAEAQVGVFYPINQILYRVFSTFTAISLSLVLHTWLAAFFAFCCARVFSLGRTSATVVGCAYAGQGFFIAHTDQLWAITTGCWLPLAVALTWLWLEQEHRFSILALPFVLAVQILAGHFQFAFFTCVTTFCLSASWLFIAGVSKTNLFRSAVPLFAVGFALGLAAIQLVPSAELFVAGDSRGRDASFLNSYSSTGFSYVSFVCPLLFRSDAMWDTVLWAQCQTSSSETLAYFGFAPFMLAIWAACNFRRDQRLKIWCVLALLSFLFSLGAWFPANWFLAELPGFKWFFAPARWNAVMGLFLALCAGWALENVTLSEFRRFARRYFQFAVVCIAMVMGFVVLIAAFSERFEQAPIEYRGLARVMQYFNAGYSEAEVLESSPSDRVPMSLLMEVLIPAVFFGLMMLSVRLGRFQYSGIMLVVFAVGDLTAHQFMMRRVEFLSISSHSVEEALGEYDVGPETRVAGVLRSLPMAAGKRVLTAPDSAEMSRFWSEGFRSEVMDLWPETVSTLPPVARWGDWGTRLGQVAREGFSDDDAVFCRLANIRHVVYGFMSIRPPQDVALVLQNRLTDQGTQKWLYGPEIKSYAKRDSVFEIWSIDSILPVSRVWSFPVSDHYEPGKDPRLMPIPPPARRMMLADAVPHNEIRDDGESLTIKGELEQPSVIVISDAAYPGWKAHDVLTDEDLQIEQAFGKWRAIAIDASGPFEIQFKFDSSAFCLGWQITLATIGFWISFATMLSMSWGSRVSSE